MSRADPLKAYRSRRNFALTPESRGDPVSPTEARTFVIQKHWARTLHYDVRLELDGSMKSWAVPKGPSLDPREKRLAVQVEDHPIAYNRFEGTIPPRQYGAGKVIIWDKGVWIPVGDPRAGYASGHLKFELQGRKLQGRWVLIRTRTKAPGQEQWLLIKEKDEDARPADEYSVVDARSASVAHSTPGAPPRRRAKAPGNEMPEGATRTRLPASLQPQLATLVDKPPDKAEDWVYEIKFDGYRLLARIDARHVRLYTRNGHDWSDKLPALVAALKQLKLQACWLDGEIVVVDEKGIPRFQALQNAFDASRTERIVYFLFDLPFYGGFDLRAAPLEERRQVLARILDQPLPTTLRLSDAFRGAPQDLLHSACRIGLEGLVGKHRRSAYSPRRSPAWVKLKCVRRQEFVVGGYTDPRGSRSAIGSLLLGVYDDSEHLRYVGNVGTGFDHDTLLTLGKRLATLKQSSSPFAARTPLDAKAHWVQPTLVAEVSFGEWTDSGRIRHAAFHGLRSDKASRAVVREQPLQAATTPRIKLPKGLNISHPGRVIDPSSGLTKLELIQYYARVAELMMAHLKARPASLLRAPDGITGQLFFQKHLEGAQMSGVNMLDPDLDPGHAALIEVAKPEGLLSAAQMNVIEFHTWNARKTNIARPDRMTFDLDPGEGVAWATLQASAHLLRDFLARLELVPFIKTTGGKGLHIVVPLKRLHGWDTVRGFSQAIVRQLAATLPHQFAAKSGPRNRVHRIFIDYLRNGFGATTVAAWSARARPGLGVSVPIEWSELDEIDSGAHWNLSNIESRLTIGNAPWARYARSAQSLGPAMKIMGYVGR